MRLDLEALARGRHADTALDNLPIKCAACGGRKFTVGIEYVDPLQRVEPQRRCTKRSL
jgi:hypothetical protein